MALVNCVECHNIVSTEALDCKHCGKPSPQPEAKPSKLPKLLTLCCLSAGLFGFLLGSWFNEAFDGLIWQGMCWVHAQIFGGE